MLSGITNFLAAIALAALLACEGPPTVVEPNETADATPSMRGFSWVEQGKLAGMPRPGASRPLAEDLSFLQDQGVDLLVSLTEVPVDATLLAAHGMAGLHLPVKDFTAPTIAQLDIYVRTVDAWNMSGRQVGTHCGAGMGRTGTFLAARFVAHGMSADAAIAEIRRLRPGSIETKAQEQAVRDYEAFLRPPVKP